MPSYRTGWSDTRIDLAECFLKWGTHRDDWAVERDRKARDRRGFLSAAERLVTVWWVHPGTDKRITLSCDENSTQPDNFRALYLCIEALRMQEVRGVGDMMATAYAQIAAPDTARDPYKVLGVRSGAPPEVIEASYKARAKLAHPDKGGTVEDMAALNAARDELVGRGVIA